jgi:hypothetical protein
MLGLRQSQVMSYQKGKEKMGVVWVGGKREREREKGRTEKRNKGRIKRVERQDKSALEFV